MDPKAFLTVAAILFSIGVTGFLTRRNLLVIFLSIELMLNAGGLALITFARLFGQADGHVVFFLILALAAAESAIGLSLVVTIFRQKHTVDAGRVTELNG